MKTLFVALSLLTASAAFAQYVPVPPTTPMPTLPAPPLPGTPGGVLPMPNPLPTYPH